MLFLTFCILKQQQSFSYYAGDEKHYFFHIVFLFFKRVNLNTQFSKTSKLVNQERNLLKIKIAGVLKDGKATNEELKMTVRSDIYFEEPSRSNGYHFFDIITKSLHHSPPPPELLQESKRRKALIFFVFLTKKSRSKRQDQTNISFLCIEIV